MTLKKIDYSKLVVYKIVCNDLRVTDLYVGSTTNFEQRKKSHKSSCCKSEKYHYLLYECIRKFGGWENWSMIIVEKCPCEDSYNARKIERFYYEELNANLNMVRPLCTEEELKLMNKEYKQTEHYKEYNKIYKEDNKEKIQEYRKKYNDEHNNEIKEKDKIYREDNKEKIQERRSEKITCSCGSVITRGHISHHKKTFKHISKSQSLFKPTDEIIHA
jgi:hypothetical protein